MSVPRFLVVELPAMGTVGLSEEESRHASGVLRLVGGDEVVLFDGRGGEAEGVIAEANKRSVSVRIARRTDRNRELTMPLEMLVALPKGDRQKTLVDAMVQLGVAKLIPLTTERGVAQPSAAAHLRLQRAVIESSKQCGRNHLMEIAAPVTIDALTVSDAGQLSLLAHPYGSAMTLLDASGAATTAGSARIAIGPEGGFSDHECAWLHSHGWQQITLGPRILRIEMAAMLVAAWWSTRQPQQSQS